MIGDDPSAVTWRGAGFGAATAADSYAGSETNAAMLSAAARVMRCTVVPPEDSDYSGSLIDNRAKMRPACATDWHAERPPRLMPRCASRLGMPEIFPPMCYAKLCLRKPARLAEW